MSKQLEDSVIGTVYEAENSMKTAELKVGAIGWEQISLTPFKRVEVVGCGSEFSKKFWFSLFLKVGKYGEVFTTESGFTPAKAEPGEIGWMIVKVKPTERRIRVIWRELPGKGWYMASSCDS